MKLTLGKRVTVRDIRTNSSLYPNIKNSCSLRLRLSLEDSLDGSLGDLAWHIILRSLVERCWWG